MPSCTTANSPGNEKTTTDRGSSPRSVAFCSLFRAVLCGGSRLLRLYPPVAEIADPVAVADRAHHAARRPTSATPPGRSCVTTLPAPPPYRRRRRRRCACRPSASGRSSPTRCCRNGRDARPGRRAAAARYSSRRRSRRTSRAAVFAAALAPAAAFGYDRIVFPNSAAVLPRSFHRSADTVLPCAEAPFIPLMTEPSVRHSCGRYTASRRVSRA